MLLKLQRHLTHRNPGSSIEIQTKPEAPKTLFEKYYATCKIHISSHTYSSIIIIVVVVVVIIIIIIIIIIITCHLNY